MVRPNAWNSRPNNIRNTRSTKQTVAKSVKTCSTSVKCKCPPSVVTYVDGVMTLVPMEQIPSTLE